MLQEAKISLYIENEKTAEFTVPDYTDNVGNSFHTIGANRYVSVTKDYESPFIFSGNIEYVKIRTADSTVSTEELINAFLAVD